MDTQQKPSLHPLYAGAAAAVILACGVASAALMGWLPTSTGGPAEKTTVQQPAISPTQSAPQSHVTSGAARPAPPNQVASAAAHPAPARQAVTAPTAAAKCADCGVVTSVQAVAHQGQGTGVGAVGGAVVGGLVGHELGSGRGKDLMTVVGAVGGGLAGNQIEKKVKSSTVYEITVRLEDGTTRVVTEANPPTWRQGDKVRIVNGQIQSNA